jgi:uncharacterized protein YfdQ (DUF2303 family)
MNQPNDVTEILSAGRAIGLPVEPNENGRDVAVVPNGYRLEALEGHVEKYLDAPRRTKVNLTLDTVDSFIAYVKEHKTEATRVLVQNALCGHMVGATPIFEAWIDFHAPGKPSWREHSARCVLQYTPDWAAWAESSGTRYEQAAFAEFIEKHQGQVTMPTGAELLELVTTLEGSTEARYTQIINLENGRKRACYERDVTLKGNTGTESKTVDFPNQLLLALPPFEGGATYKVAARMRYRLSNGCITFWYELVDPVLILRDAVKESLGKIAKELGINPLWGAIR